MNKHDPSSALARHLYSAIERSDIEAALPLLSPDVRLVVPGTHSLAGEHVGPAAVLTFIAASRALTDDGEHIEVRDVLEGAQHVAVYCRVTARRGSASLDNSTIHLLRIEAGRVVEIRFHNFDDLAVNEFWSAA